MSTQLIRQIDKNPARVAKLRDKTLDMFAVNGGEELTLIGQELPQGETFAERCEQAARDRAQKESEQELFGPDAR